MFGVSKFRLLKELIIITCVVIICVYLSHGGKAVEKSKDPVKTHVPMDEIIPLRNGFEPDIHRDFPTIKDAKVSKIPHIMHQMWISDNNSENVGLNKDGSISVPEKYKESVQSFFTHHTQWSYYFWDATSCRNLVKTAFPRLLNIYDSYTSNIHKSDAIRYMILYTIGGVYADLDISFKRSLDKVTIKYPCVLNPAPFEHPVLLNTGQPFRINNNLIFCRRGHPFLKFVVDSLTSARVYVHTLDIAGPGFLTASMVRYFNLSGSELFHAYTEDYRDDVTPYFYRGDLSPTDQRYIYVANSQYFGLPIQKDYEAICKSKDIRDSSVKIRMCHYLRRRGYNRSLSKLVFTFHAWTNSINDIGNYKRNVNVDNTYSNRLLTYSTT